jgi:hypothetical protein
MVQVHPVGQSLGLLAAFPFSSLALAAPCAGNGTKIVRKIIQLQKDVVALLNLGI